MGIISRIRGMQAQAEYETQNRSSINRIEQQAYEEAKVQRERVEAARKASAKERAIAEARERGAKRAKPIPERIEDNFDEALERALKTAKVVDQKAQNFVKSPKVQKKISNARHNLGDVTNDVIKATATPKRATRRTAKQQVTHQVKQANKSHPVHVKKQKPVIGSHKSLGARFGTRPSKPTTKRFGIR